MVVQSGSAHGVQAFPVHASPDGQLPQEMVSPQPSATVPHVFP